VGLKSSEEFENANSQYLKHMELEAREHVTLSREPSLPLPFRHPPRLFSLIPYMLRKYD
jgi:hypothetical protein